jgi:transcriptional regulator with XRE-family HTH domain
MLMSESTVRIRLIGAELRRHREAAGLTLTELATRIGIEKSQLSRMETGDRAQKCEDVAGMLAIYGVIGEERRQLLQLSRESDRVGLWQRHSGSLAERIAALQTLESRAIKLIEFQCQLIPGLLQTVPYIRALMRNVGLLDDEEVIGERVAARLFRQAVVRKSGAPEFLAIITEGALRNIVGDAEVMREQLTYLIEAAQRPNIKLRVIPASVGNHPGLEGPFIRMQFHDRRGVVVLVNRTSNLYLEDDSDLVAYNHVLVELLSVALNEEESVALVRELAQEQFQRCQ